MSVSTQIPYSEIKIGQNVLPTDHPYQKDAKSFIRGIKKNQQLIKEQKELKAPILAEFGVNSDWDLKGNAFDSYLQRLFITGIKFKLDDLRGKEIRLGRRLDKLKWGYWACYPKGCEQYYSVYPDSRRK
jgi:hypothetical protein